MQEVNDRTMKVYLGDTTVVDSNFVLEVRDAPSTVCRGSGPSSRRWRLIR